jgi:putative tryptophan/tyrosine transport system substrate-binding protein
MQKLFCRFGQFQRLTSSDVEFRRTKSTFYKFNIRRPEMTRKIIACMTIISMAIVGCEHKSQNTAEIKNVVVIKFVTHPALDELENGFLDYLESLKKSNPKLANLNIEQYNANGNPQRAKELAEVASRSDVQLIVAIATPAAQAVIRTPTKIPLLYGAVADPNGAGILSSGRATGIQNAGPNIIQKAITVIHSFFPEVKRIGTMYNPAEQNSNYVQKYIKEFSASGNLELIQRTVTDPTQLSSVTEDLASSVDLIYSANDNTVNTGVASVVSVCNAKKKPFVIGDLSTLSKGPLLAVGLDYGLMGKQLGTMAEQILLGKTISEVPPQGPPDPKVWLNGDTLATLGLKIPPGIAPDFVYYSK